MTDRKQTLTFRGKIRTRDEAGSLLAAPGDAVIVERSIPRLLIMRCPCGCGDDLLINLDRRIGPAWRHYLTRRGLTLYPSYWRDTACGSHFIIWNDRIYWCMGWDDDETDSWTVTESVEQLVFASLPSDRFVNYDDLANQLDLIPWEVLQACRQLVKHGSAISRKVPATIEFRRSSSGPN